MLWLKLTRISKKKASWSSVCILIPVESGRGDSAWFACGTQHACKIFSEPKNWHDAEAACNAEFGHLASIVSIIEDREPIASNASVSIVQAYSE